jgi:vacuolar-type H+-ATPase subunit F/Vma7
MSDFVHIAVIGERDLVFGFRALGMQTFSPASAEEAEKMASKIVQGDFALCLVDQRWLAAFKEEEATAGGKFCPVIVGFSDYRSLSDEVEKRVREMAVKATGSDSLVKRKGSHE